MTSNIGQCAEEWNSSMLKNSYTQRDSILSYYAVHPSPLNQFKVTDYLCDKCRFMTRCWVAVYIFIFIAQKANGVIDVCSTWEGATYCLGTVWNNVIRLGNWKCQYVPGNGKITASTVELLTSTLHDKSKLSSPWDLADLAVAVLSPYAWVDSSLVMEIG